MIYIIKLRLGLGLGLPPYDHPPLGRIRVAALWSPSFRETITLRSNLMFFVGKSSICTPSPACVWMDMAPNQPSPQLPFPRRESQHYINWKNNDNMGLRNRTFSKWITRNSNSEQLNKFRILTCLILHFAAIFSAKCKIRHFNMRNLFCKISITTSF